MVLGRSVQSSTESTAAMLALMALTDDRMSVGTCTTVLVQSLLMVTGQHADTGGRQLRLPREATGNRRGLMSEAVSHALPHHAGKCPTLKINKPVSISQR